MRVVENGIEALYTGFIDGEISLVNNLFYSGDVGLNNIRQWDAVLENNHSLRELLFSNDIVVHSIPKRRREISIKDQVRESAKEKIYMYWQPLTENTRNAFKKYLTTLDDLTEAEWDDVVHHSEDIFTVCSFNGKRFANNNRENFQTERVAISKHLREAGQYLDYVS